MYESEINDDLITWHERGEHLPCAVFMTDSMQLHSERYDVIATALQRMRELLVDHDLSADVWYLVEGAMYSPSDNDAARGAESRWRKPGKDCSRVQ